MNIQIGLPCEPAWLCDAIGWVIAIIVLVAIVGLLNVIRKDQQAQKKRRNRRLSDRKDD